MNEKNIDLALSEAQTNYKRAIKRYVSARDAYKEPVDRLLEARLTLADKLLSDAAEHLARVQFAAEEASS